MAEILLGGKRLAELKVTELKSELEKRSLSKRGVKTVLVGRLRNAILKEELVHSEDLAGSATEEDISQTDASHTEDEAVLVHSSGEGEPPQAASEGLMEVEGETPQAASEGAMAVEEPRPEPLDPASSDQSAIDIEATSPSFLDNNTSHDEHVTSHMELTTPLSPGSELELSMDGSLLGDADSAAGDEGRPEEDVDVTSLDLSGEGGQRESREEEKEEEEEEGGSGGGAGIASSYLPDSEELLYEGDVEHEATPTLSEAPPPSSEGHTAEEEGGGLIVVLHAPSTDLDAPKKEANSAPKGEATATAASAPERPADCNLWVAGLVASVRALDLQTLFSPFGQVISARVVAKRAGSVAMAAPRANNNRFGYVTMATVEQAQRCIRELNETELKGKKITVTVAPSSYKPPPVQSAPPTDPAPITPLMDVHLPKETSAGKSATADKRSKPKQSAHRERVGPHRRSSSGRGRSPPGSILRGSAQRRSSPGPLLRRGGSPPGRGRSPPRSAGRLGPIRRRSRSPPRRIVSHVGLRGDARQDILRRAMVRRLSGSGGESFLSERERQSQLRLQERRVAHDRMARDRHHEMQIRRQVEAEHARREQEILRRIQEREARDREAVNRQMAEQARLYKERERELREREQRERQRRELLERELKEKEGRERELREREKRLKEQHEREMREKELKAQRERDARERELRAQVERERELRGRERLLREEAERERRAQEEAQRQLREQQQRAREEAARLREEQQAREARVREEQERRERERKEQQERSKMKREREELQSSGSRLGKRTYSDGGGGNSYEPSKRPAVHAVQRASESFNSANVFGRLDAHSLQKHSEGSAIPSLMTSQHGGFRRDTDSAFSQAGASRHSTGSYMVGGGGGGGSFMGGGRDRQSTGSVHYPIQLPGGRSTQEFYTKALSGGPQQQTARGGKPETATPLTTRLNPEVINAATQALENIRKSVQVRGGQLQTPGSMAAHLHQLSAGYLPHRQQQPSAAAFPSGAAESKKLPPEEERYNRRLGSRGHHGFGQRQPYKRL